MPAAQLDLDFSRPVADARGVRALVAALRGRGWLTARELSAELHVSDRAVRELAACSDDVISYPGSPGYKLLADCTREEYDRYRAARRSQARDMLAKVIRTDRIFFRRTAATI